MTKIALIHLDLGRHDKARFERDRREFLPPLTARPFRGIIQTIEPVVPKGILQGKSEMM